MICHGINHIIIRSWITVTSRSCLKRHDFFQQLVIITRISNHNFNEINCLCSSAIRSISINAIETIFLINPIQHISHITGYKSFIYSCKHKSIAAQQIKIHIPEVSVCFSQFDFLFKFSYIPFNITPKFIFTRLTHYFFIFLLITFCCLYHNLCLSQFCNPQLSDI